MTGTEADDTAAMTAIMAVQNAYAVALDTRDWPALRDCFTPDASIRFGIPARVGTLEEFMAWAPPFHADFAATLHQVSTHHAVPRGDTAIASCSLHALLLGADHEIVMAVFGRYDDEFVRTGGRWRIRRRVFRPRHSATPGARSAEGAQP